MKRVCSDTSGSMQLKTNGCNTLQALCLHGRATGSVKRPEADTTEYICILISPLFPAKSGILNQTVSSSKEDEPFGHEQHDTPDTHPRTRVQARACSQRHAYTLSHPPSPLKLCQCYSVPERSTIVILKDSQQLVCAAQMQSMPIICWNPFILLLYLKTDLEQHHLVQMNEPVSLNNSFFPHGESFGWVGVGHTHIVSSVFNSGN